jgi:microcin C transport system substrate-binding protein
MKNCSLNSAFLCTLLVFGGCQAPDEDLSAEGDFEKWYPQYNRYIRNWLAQQIEDIEQKYDADKDGLLDNNETAGISPADKKALARFKGRQEMGDYFQFKTIEDLPEGLAWEDGMDQPEIGDPAAKKGGTFRYYISSFPPTIRQYGPNGNNSFRGELYDNIEVNLIELHPETGEVIPGVAKEWAIGDDNKTVFFRIDPDARYNDGVPIKAIDVMWHVYVRASDNVVAPWYQQYFREEFAKFTLYSDDLIGISLPEPKPKLPYYAGDGEFISPSPPHHYKEYGPDFKERYQWRVPPTTAAYTIKPGDLVKGVSITLSRVDNWWAADKKFYRYRYNVDRMHYTVIRDRAKAWELFRAGELDYFSITLPEYWYEKSEMPPVFDGYVERYTWYNQYPRIPWSLYLNTANPPLDNHDVRLGICYASNWQKVIDVIFRGDASRLPAWTKGYGRFDNPDVMARPFSISKAREHFEKAGYVKEDENGILMKEDGQRLEASLTFTRVPVREKMMGILKEEARKAGLKIILDGLDHTVVYKKEMQKKHQIVFSAWGFQLPYPVYHEFFHSSNAYDDKGNLKHNTNNVFSFSEERMDQLIVANRNARTEEEKEKYGHKMEQVIHDSGAYVPGYMTEFVRIGCWRWVRWPDSKFTEFCPPREYVPYEGYVFWIDEDMQKETEAARRSGIKFPEVQAVKQRYRTKTKPKDQADE